MSNAENMTYALITGASAGLGAEFARQLAAAGHNLILVARRREKLAALANALAAEYGVVTEIIVADLAEPAAPATIEATCNHRGWVVDRLVNNAGIAGPDLIKDRDWQEQSAFFQLMMTSVAEMCHRFIPDMLEREFGRVINIASVAGRVHARVAVTTDRVKPTSWPYQKN